MTKNCHEIDIHMSYASKQITNVHNTKFLELMIDISLSCKNYSDELISKLNKACYAVRSVTALMSPEVLRMIYFSYVHTIISHGIIFWRNSSHSKIIFKIQKRIIRVIMNCSSRNSCHDLFKKLNIFLSQSQYLFSLLLFVIKNRDLFRSNSEVHNVSTRYISYLHLPIVNLTVFQKGAFYSGIRIFSHLPSTIKDLSYDVKQFELAFKKFLLTNSFYCLEKHFDWK